MDCPSEKFGLKTHGMLSAKSVRHGIVECAGATGCNAPRLVLNADLVSASPKCHLGGYIFVVDNVDGLAADCEIAPCPTDVVPG